MTVTTYNEILTYCCLGIDHEELSLDDAICLVAQFTSCIAEPIYVQNIFPKGFQLNGQELRSITTDCGMCT